MRICLVACGCGQFSGLCVFGAFVKWPVIWPLQVKGFTKVLEYKSALSRKIKFVCVAICIP